MPNYTVIHGNVIYKVKDVTYDSGTTHRRFLRDGKMILSVPLSSVMVKDGEGVESQIVSGLNSGVGFQKPAENNTTVIQSNNDFVEGAILGGIVGAILF